MTLHRRLRALLPALLASLPVVAAAQAAAPASKGAAPAGDKDWVLAVSEVTSGGTDHARVVAKYGALANVIGEAAKHKVVVVFVREFAQLDEGMKAGRYDFVFARPSDYPARGVARDGYRYVANAQPDGHCLIVVPKTSGLKTLADARGKRWVLPEQAAYMSKFCRAELRDQGIDLAAEKVTYAREQSSVGQYLETGLADVGGIASYSGLAKEWTRAGHVVLHKSVGQPYFPLVAGKSVSPRQVEAVQKQLAGLASQPGGAEVLKTVGVAGFDTAGEQRLNALLPWLEKPAGAKVAKP